MRHADPPAAPAGARPAILGWMAIALVPAFVATGLVTQGFRSEQRRLATEWFDKGNAALEANRPEAAITAFRTALTFSREDRVFRLRLAQALAAAGRTTEARAYLLTLRDQQPGNGPVNLELARLAAGNGQTNEAYRYYHAAIEGAWTDAAEAQRRSIRLELAAFLVRQGEGLRAQAELVALEGDLPADPEMRKAVGALMLDAGLPGRARRIYDDLLRANSRDTVALAGAGRAAFEDGSYAAAETLLGRAVAAGATDNDLQAMLSLVRLIVRLDPYQRRLPIRTRVTRAREALTIAAARLTSCSTARPDPRLTALAGEVAGQEDTLGSPDTRDLDAVDAAMDVVFRIEQTAATVCGAPEGADRALLLIARLRAGGAS